MNNFVALLKDLCGSFPSSLEVMPLGGIPVTLENYDNIVAPRHIINLDYLTNGWSDYADRKYDETVVYSNNTISFILRRPKYHITNNDTVLTIATKAFPIAWHPFEVQEYAFLAHQDKMFSPSDLRAIVPARPRIFAAFEAVAPENVKVVIIGKEPYLKEGVDTGFAYSSNRNSSYVHPALKEGIYKELAREFGSNGWKAPSHGDLSAWAKQGVLLFNVYLTSVRDVSLKHKYHWMGFAEAIIRFLCKKYVHIVFMLWGSEVSKLKTSITGAQLKLEAAHPGYKAAKKPFIGCGHFSQANDYLIQHERGAIDWSLD